MEVIKLEHNNCKSSETNKKLLANRYQIQQLIATGGMGKVFLGADILLGGVSVAIKFLSQTVANSQMQNDFAREARICAALSQKSLHIVRVTDYGVSDKGKPFYVMEYLEGKSLQDLIPMPLSTFIFITRQICLGLQSAHQGITIDGKLHPLIHRDIKPANILVVPDRILGQLVKILDFGIATFLNSPVTQNDSQICNGTFPYSSPEQLEAEELDHRSDIYSLGVTMFEMLTGEKPWKPETDYFGAWYQAHHFQPPRTISSVNPDLQIPQALENLIMACLAKKPSDRPQNLAEVLKVLEVVETAEKQQQHKPTKAARSIPLLVERACRQLVWAKNKPIQEIVFPQPIPTEQGTVVVLSLMMSLAEIVSRPLSLGYNQFVFLDSPHPMLLWVSLLYHPQLGPKWLPCYLDMQNPFYQKLVSVLAQQEQYPVIFFPLEPPHRSADVISIAIDENKRQLLKTSLTKSQNLPQTNQAQVSKNLLKQQYKHIQSQMLQEVPLVSNC